MRPFRRFPVCCPIASHVGDFEGQGIVWNVSPKGWRLSGDLPLRIGEVCSLTVTLPTQCGRQHRPMGAWEEFVLETLVMDEESRMDLYEYLGDRVAE